MRNLYAIAPQIALTNPCETSIRMDAVSVIFDGKTVNYRARTFTIPAPCTPTWYYITVAQAEGIATCETSDELVGIEGQIYIGAIHALPAGGSTNALAGGWPAPVTFRVGD